ncbi:carbohydrate kinase family protein [Candidatus Dependentiae bacterium]|nr:carbohydrate kinase family protein [Candidatus Dependentiae bacterium]
MHVITIGGATQDIFLSYQGADSVTIAKRDFAEHYMLFESGEKIEVDNIAYILGGGATNSAASFKKQGFDVSTFCKIGTDLTGDFVLSELHKLEINTDLLRRLATHETGRSFIINSLQGKRTIFAFRGANNHLDLTSLVCDELNMADLLYITSLSNQSATILPSLVACAQNFNIPIAINPGSSQLTKGADGLKLSLKHIKILILNASEAHSFMISLIESNDIYKHALRTNQPNKKTTTANDAPYLLSNPVAYNNLYFSMQQFFKEVLSMGPEIVVITNGANGVYVATHDEILFHSSIKTEVIDTVGAGDAFGSCFTGSLIQGYSLEDSLRRGVVNSASVLRFLGAKAGLLTTDQLEKQTAIVDKNLLQRFPLLR